MMLDINIDAMRQGFWKHFPLAGVVGVVIALEMAVVLLGGFPVTEAPSPTPQQVELGNAKLLGIEMYSNYLYPLEIAAVILLVAIVAAIALTLRRRKDSRYINPADQIRVKKADRLRIVKVQPVVEVPAAPAEGGEGAAANIAAKGGQA
jgi:NADH-quinone oxidoreductase subunit J